MLAPSHHHHIFLPFSPQWIFISQTDRKAGGGGKKKEKEHFSLYFCMGLQKSLKLNTTQAEKEVGRDYQEPGKSRVQSVVR